MLYRVRRIIDVSISRMTNDVPSSSSRKKKICKY